MRVESTTEMKIEALATIEQNIEIRQLIDPEGRPLTLAMTMQSSGHSTKVDARFTPSKVECTVESGGTKRSHSVDIPEGVTLVADPEQVGPKGVGTKLKPGVKTRLHMFEPVNLQIMAIDLEVGEAETIQVGGKQYKATVMKTTNPLTGQSTSWLDEKGELLQMESALGLKIVRETAGVPTPPQTAYTPPRDFAVATSVRTKIAIKEPRKVSFLRMRIRGIPEERLILSDSRQAADVTRENGKLVVTYTIRADATEGLEQAGAAQAALSERTYARTTEHLAAAPYLEVDDPRIQKQAREIVGDATDPLEKVRLIRAWVHKEMTSKGDIGVIRSATDILQRPVGVCRDYAILFTALARAAGVPTRTCGGIVYFKDAFFYHAWSEVGVRSSVVGLRDGQAERRTPNAERLTWVPFDATLPTDFVDATHIKFAQGDPTAMFGAVRVVGQIQAEVLEYR